MTDISRRQTIVLAFGATFAAQKMALAQAVTKDMANSLADAFFLQEQALNARVDKDFAAFVTNEFFSRQRMVYAATVSERFYSQDRATDYLKSLVGASAPDVPSSYFTQPSIEAQLQAVSFVAAAGVPLVPDRRDILPIGVPTADPAEKGDRDSDFTVMLDIALQTMGIFDGRILVDEILKDKDVSAFLENIYPDLKAGDWKKIIGIAEKLFKVVLASTTLQSYAARVGKRFAFRLTLRCVPISGWIYVAASFIVALKANYHRFSFS